MIQRCYNCKYYKILEYVYTFVDYCCTISWDKNIEPLDGGVNCKEWADTAKVNYDPEMRV